MFTTILVACAPAAPSLTPTPAPTLTPTLTVTPPPTFTPTITPTPRGGGTGKLVFQYAREGYEKDFPNLQGDSNLFIVNWDGTGLTPVTNGLLDYSMFKGVSPDGKKALLFFAPPMYTAVEGTSILYVMDLTQPNPQPIKIASGIFEATYKTASWLDSSRVVYVDQVPGGWAIFVINSDGTDPKRISQRVNGITPREVVATADQSRIFWLGVDASTPGWTHKGIWWTSMDGSQQAQLIQLSRRGNISFSLNNFSPDGSMVVWEYNTWENTGTGCCSVRFALTSEMDNATEIKLEPKTGVLVGPSPDIIWAPDGSRVIINRQASATKFNDQIVFDPGQMFILSPSTLALKEIVLQSPDASIKYPNIEVVQWLPDGKSLLVRVRCVTYATDYQCGGGKIKILDLETGVFTEVFGGKVDPNRIGNVFWLPE